MDWVYGFRCRDVKKPILFIQKKFMLLLLIIFCFSKGYSELLLYMTGCIVVVYQI